MVKYLVVFKNKRATGCVSLTISCATIHQLSQKIKEWEEIFPDDFYKIVSIEEV